MEVAEGALVVKLVAALLGLTLVGWVFSFKTGFAPRGILVLRRK